MTRRSARFTLILVLFLGVAPSVAPAQGVRPPDRTLLGFEVGFSSSSFEPSAGTGAREGGMIGSFVAQRLSNLFSAQVELVFTKKGGSLPAVTPTGSTAAAVQLVYVEAPVLARVTLPVGSRLRPVLFGGGSFALSVGCEFQVEVQGVVAESRCDQPGTGLELSSTDWSAILGGGIEYAWKRSTEIRLEIRRFIGLHNVVEGSEGKNRAWVALFGITF